MAKYRIRDSDRDSIYESDEGESYSNAQYLGSGASSFARKFKRATEFPIDCTLPEPKRKKAEEIAVLEPTNSTFVDFMEVITKYLFFKTVYPQFNVRLFLTKKTYRLILPLISGTTYQNTPYTDNDNEIKLFISAIRAIRNCHEKHFVISDLHGSNIHYDEATGKSYIIDGGLAARIGRPINDSFKIRRYETREYVLEKAPHIAPECWWTTIAPKADIKQDVYSLGDLMQHRINTLKIRTSQEINDLINRCMDSNPANRPSLDELEEKLLKLLPSDIIKSLGSHEQYYSLEEQDQEISIIFKNLDMDISEEQLQKIHQDTNYKNAILLFNALCEQLAFPENTIQSQALKTYQKETLELILQGKEAFEGQYEAVKEKAIAAIENDIFAKVARIVGNAIIIATLIGALLMAITSNERGGFLFFKSPTEQVINKVEQPIKVLNNFDP